MTELFEALSSINFAVLKVIGMVISGVTGLIMSWISRRSVNYRKIDKRMLLAAFLFFVYLNALTVVTTFIGTILIVLFVPLDAFALQMLLSAGMGVLTILLFWGLILKSKHMKLMMDRAKQVSRRLFLWINWLSLVSVVLNFVYIPFILTEQQNMLTRIMVVTNWIIAIWWLYFISTFIWKTSKYVYSEMKVTLLDGEVVEHNCSPQMCRVHKNYIRLLKRDEKGTIVYERHINEAAIKQIEYA